jgi:hypothetical protein
MAVVHTVKFHFFAKFFVAQTERRRLCNPRSLDKGTAAADDRFCFYWFFDELS